MLKKLVIVYNAQASKQAVVQREVLAPARKLQGCLVGKYAIKAGGVQKNIENLAKIIEEGDLVVAVGGDGTAMVAANAILRSGKKAVFAALGYGNLNDVARSLKAKRAVEYGGEFVGGITEIVRAWNEGRKEKFYPLEVKVDGEVWRYGLNYVTIGMLAAATEVFDEEKVREKLQKGKKGVIFSIGQAVRWYLGRNTEKGRELPVGEFLQNAQESVEKKREPRGKEPEIMIDGAGRFPTGTTDYVAVNGPRVARILRGRKWYREAKEFQSGMFRLGRLWGMMGFAIRGIFWRVPGKRTKKDVIEFREPSEVIMQTEGEAEKLEKVRKVEISKGEKVMEVVSFAVKKG